MLARASERYEGGLTAYGPRDFQLRIARVADRSAAAASGTQGRGLRARSFLVSAAAACWKCSSSFSNATDPGRFEDCARKMSPAA